MGHYEQKTECLLCFGSLVIVTKCGAVVDLLTTITSLEVSLPQDELVAGSD